MNTKDRLKQLADQVKAAGLAGESMQKKLAKIVADNDLTHHEIQRIAEMANRDVQLGLYKVSADKRFKFELANPEPLKAAARLSSVGGDQDKTASLSAVGADPFAVPYRYTKLSVFEAPLEEGYAHELESAETRKMLQDLDKMRLETDSLIKEGEAETVKICGKAHKDHEAAVQGAINLVMGGVTLCSLYQAVIASVSGSRSSNESRKQAEDLMMLIIVGLKKRGVPNHRMGFAHKGDVNALDRKSPEEIMGLCTQACHGYRTTDLTMEASKAANYSEQVVSQGASKDPFLHDEASRYLSTRPSNSKYPVPQQYLDSKNVSNDKPRVFNTDNEFIIAINDLMGDQSRLTRLHGAQEYLGLKLKQIESAMHGLSSAQKTADAEAAKRAGVLGTLGSQAKANPLAALGVAASAASVAPLMMESADGKKQRAHEKQMMSMQQGMPRTASVEYEQDGAKIAFIPALVGAAEAAGPLLSAGASALGIASAAKSLMPGKPAAAPAAPTAPAAPKPRLV